MPSASTLRVAGVNVVYDRAGDGPPLVLIHGAAGDAREWRPQMADLSDDFTVIAWDEPGAGRSSDVPPEFGLAGYAMALGALIDTLGAPAHVCGLSWGGTVALELYRRRSQAVATLVLADTYAGWKGSLAETEVRTRVRSVERMLAEAALTGLPPVMSGLFAGEPPGDAVELLAAVAADVRPESLRVTLMAMAEADLRDVLPSITVPTLLIWGERDARSPLTVARQSARAIPDAELVLIPGAGHVSNLERPDALNAAMRAFYARLR